MPTLSVANANAILRAQWHRARSINDLARVFGAWHEFALEHGLPSPSEQLQAERDRRGRP